MTAAELNDLLREPAGLANVPLQDLESLARQFPYSPNLRLLLLLRARLNEEGNLDAYLQRCAAATCDRSYLYDLLAELDTADLSPLELPRSERLELRELEELLQPEDTPRTTPQTAFLALDEAPAPEKESFAALIVDTPPSPPPPPLDLEDWALTATAFLNARIAPDFTDASPPPHVPETITGSSAAPPSVSAPSGPTTLPAQPPRVVGPRPSRSREPEPLSNRLQRLRRRNQARRRPGEDSTDVSRIARRSVTKTEGLASETLADLLVRQGQYEKAIRMYRRLSLLNPGKSRIFAGLIAELQQKL